MSIFSPRIFGFFHHKNIHSKRLPLSWLLLRRQPVKFVTAITGIIFASILILMQLGFKAALMQSSISMIQYFNADIVMVNSLSVSTTSLEPFDPARLQQLEHFSEVSSTNPVRWGYLKWQYQNGDGKRLIMAVGLDPFKNTINKSDVLSHQYLLQQPNSVLFDEKARPEFGPVFTDFYEGRDPVAYVNDNRIHVVGFYRIGVSFGYDGTLITSASNFESMTNLSPELIEIGFVKLRPGVDADAALKVFNANLPSDVRLFTKKQFEDFEKNYWATSRPIGFVFGFGTIMGFFVGLILIYQILYSDISFHIHEYATMLSLGFVKNNLNAIVVNEALLISIFGYPLGLLSSLLLYMLVRDKTRIVMFMTTERAVGAFFLIIGMSICSALLALRRLNDADPTEVFS